MSGYPTFRSRRLVARQKLKTNGQQRSVFSRMTWFANIKQQHQRMLFRSTRSNRVLIPTFFQQQQQQQQQQRRRQETGFWKYSQHHRNNRLVQSQKQSPHRHHTSPVIHRKGTGIPVLAYYPIHYGAEYLKESIQSIEKFVDEILIFYSPWPSYGFNSNAKCPESEEQIKNIAMSASGKVTWIRLKDRPTGEGEHRQLWKRFVRPYHDLLLQFDADEVWEEQSLKNSLSEAMRLKYKYRNFGIDGFKHFWKSFSWHCTDSFLPIRIISLRSPNNEMTSIKSTIYHFGYAQSSAIMNYKFEIHGHKQEIRSDWLAKKYYGWKVGDNDVHPTSIGLWNPQPFDKHTLPNCLHQHPNFNRDTI